MSIIEAISTLRDELEAGQSVEKAMDWVASDYGFKPEVIAIRFERAYGAKPQDFQPKAQKSIQDLVAEILERETKKWRHTDLSLAVVGTRFFIDSEWWLFVAFDGTRVHAVREDTSKVWNFSGSWVQKILAQVEKKKAA
jgi:hypothetical protein